MRFLDGFIIGMGATLLTVVVLIVTGALDNWIKRWRDWR